MARFQLTLESSAFENGQMMPKEFTADGVDRPPELHWSHAPARAKSFVLMMEDPDAPGGSFTHWVRYDVPRSKEGKNDFQTIGYRGPSPPRRLGKHRYLFRLYALDVDTIGLSVGADRKAVEGAMEGHVLEEAILMGLYERR